MAENKLKKIAKAAKIAEPKPTTKMGPDGEFLIKEQEFRTKGGQTVEPNKGLADKVRNTIKETNRIKEIRDTKPYYEGELKKGRGVTIEPNKNVAKLAIDAKRPDMPDIKPVTDRDFETKGGRTIEPNKEIADKARETRKQIRKIKGPPTSMPNVSDKQVKKMEAARKIHGAAPVESEFWPIKKITPKKPAPGPGLGQRIADKVIKAHDSHLGQLAKKAASSKVAFVKTAARRAVGSVGGTIAKKVLSKAIGRAAVPVGLAMDVYEIGTAVKEGYKAYQAGKEYRTLYEKMKNKKYKPAISPDGKPSGL